MPTVETKIAQQNVPLKFFVVLLVFKIQLIALCNFCNYFEAKQKSRILS